jgi:hypothetical protein
VPSVLWKLSGKLRLDGYGEKMANDLFDGKKGFAIDGGIKDSTYENTFCISAI